MRPSLVLSGFVSVLAAVVAAPLFAASTQAATTQLLLTRDGQPDGIIKGVVDLTVSPGFEDARVTDNGSEGTILEFGKAFDQQISIALIVDASASMTYSMEDATKAALSFVQRTLKQGDRCTVFSVRDSPR